MMTLEEMIEKLKEDPTWTPVETEDEEVMAIFEEALKAVNSEGSSDEEASGDADWSSNDWTDDDSGDGDALDW